MLTNIQKTSDHEKWNLGPSQCHSPLRILFSVHVGAQEPPTSRQRVPDSLGWIRKTLKAMRSKSSEQWPGRVGFRGERLPEGTVRAQRCVHLREQGAGSEGRQRD